MLEIYAWEIGSKPSEWKFWHLHGAKSFTDVWVVMWGEMPSTIHFTEKEAIDFLAHCAQVYDVPIERACIRKTKLQPIETQVKKQIETGLAMEVFSGKEPFGRTEG